MAQILVLSDTHVRTLQELPEEILQAIKESEWVVHCGDYTSMVVVEELRHLSRHFVGVYGNADARDIIHRLPADVTFQLEGRSIAVTHPSWGGHPDGLEKQLYARFPDVDVILFGHTHEPCNLNLNGTLLLNPGQGYPSFMVRASIGILTISNNQLIGEISVMG